jgi:hypothetical protein
MALLVPKLVLGSEVCLWPNLVDLGPDNIGAIVIAGNPAVSDRSTVDLSNLKLPPCFALSLEKPVRFI